MIIDEREKIVLRSMCLNTSVKCILQAPLEISARCLWAFLKHLFDSGCVLIYPNPLLN